MHAVADAFRPFYDADQRLTCATLASNCSSPTFVYDDGVAGPGNITTQTGVGTYTYPAAGQSRPHAVTGIAGTFNGITNPSFSYDANGNMNSRAGSTVTWSSYNYPTDIVASDATGAEEVQLSYGPDRQRWKQIYMGPSGTETTYYIGGLVDLVFIGGVANYRHYIYAGSEPVAVYNRTAAGNTMSYMLEDHQGSVLTIASNAGTASVNESFSAFGNRRDPGSWSGPPSTLDLNKIAGLSRQGYTFQTWLGQSMGLNHMNGRVEDAILGRFLSPDPRIPDPSNAQSYNRFSYVNNNPLSMIDPSGFCGYAVAYSPGFISTADGTGGISQEIISNIGFAYTYYDASDCFSSPDAALFTPPGLSAPFVPPPIPPFDNASVPAPPPVKIQAPLTPLCQQGAVPDALRSLNQASKDLQKFSRNMIKGGIALEGIALLTIEAPPVSASAAAAGGAGIFGGGVMNTVGDVTQVLTAIGLAFYGDSQPLRVAGFEVGSDVVKTVIDAPPLPLGIPDPADDTEKAVGRDPCN